MRRREVRWERMFPDELDAAFEECPIVYLPYGLCEPHGPQNALGMDALRAHAASCVAAHEHGGIVAPAFYWHNHEQGMSAIWAYPIIGNVRPWLTATPIWMFIKNMYYHLRTADSLGFHGAVIFSGHAGPFTEDIPRLLKILQKHMAMRIDITFGVATSSRFDDDKGMGGHAGRGETSLLWASDPDCVDLSRVPAPDDPGPHFAMGDLVMESSRRAGELMLAEAGDKLGAMGKQLLEDYAKLKPEHKPLTFDQIEAIWDQEVRPLIKDLDTMQDMRPGQTPPPEDSRWYANWRTRYQG